MTKLSPLRCLGSKLDWLGQERETIVRVFAVAVLLGLSAGPVLADDYKALPEGPGRDVTVRVCSQCHSPEIAAHQTLDAQGWKDLVNQMANNGANATDAEFDTIAKYLAASFPAK
jgi:mono/diheme cytochrome c family protein